jgi:predicted lipase
VLSREIYQDFAQLRFSDFPNLTPDLITDQQTDTQCAILSSGDTTYIVFRGSTTQLDWKTNFEFEQELTDFRQEVVQQSIVQEREQVYPYEEESKANAKMHKGFVTAYFGVRTSICKLLKERTTARVIATGHSLGGALATLCAVDLQFNFAGQFAIESYTYGAPRVGNQGFVDSFNHRVPNSFRFVYGLDIVPALPRVWQNYRHVDQEFHLGDRFSWQLLSRRWRDHSIANYINALKMQG